MKKMYTIGEKVNYRAGTGKAEGFVTFCLKAQKHIVKLFLEQVEKLGTNETELLAKYGFPSSGMSQFKKAGTKDGQDRGMYQGSVERMSSMLGFSQVSELFADLDLISGVSTPATSSAISSSTQRVFAIGPGSTVIQNGKSRIVLNNVNADIRKGSSGETIVDVT